MQYLTVSRRQQITDKLQQGSGWVIGEALWDVRPYKRLDDGDTEDKIQVDSKWNGQES
jgi:hypothetical protein